MQTETDKPAQEPMIEPMIEPIIEPWRIAALILVVAVGMLFVHAVVPADAGALAAPPGPSSPR